MTVDTGFKLQLAQQPRSLGWQVARLTVQGLGVSVLLGAGFGEWGFRIER